MTTTPSPTTAAPHRVHRPGLRATAKALPEHTRAHNRSMVLQHLFHAGPSSRADLARSTGLTRVTISDLVGELMAADLVEEAGVANQTRVGKPATLIRMRTDEFAIVAVDVADDLEMRGAVLNLTGDILERRSVSQEGQRGEATITTLLELCRELLGATELPVIGVGVASPGVINSLGTVLQAPNRGWFDVPLAERLATELGIPAHVANDANTSALAEYTLGGADGSGLLTLTVRHGVGAGLVLHGDLVRGPGHAAGELGHVTVIDEDSGEKPARCACGRDGCLETILSAPALRARVSGLDPQDSDAALASVGRRLGIVLAPVVSALDLNEILLCGPQELLAGPLAEAALDTIRQRSMPVSSTGLDIRMAALGPDVALQGAAVLVLSGQLGVT